jgi:hypothetical protein
MCAGICFDTSFSEVSMALQHVSGVCCLFYFSANNSIILYWYLPQTSSFKYVYRLCWYKLSVLFCV